VEAKSGSAGFENGLVKGETCCGRFPVGTGWNVPCKKRFMALSKATGVAIQPEFLSKVSYVRLSSRGHVRPSSCLD
jgi:hypothetical protein